MTEVLPKVPVFIVTGPLGAGKSTLIRRILTERHNLRLAVIENEFAESMGVESLVLKQDLAEGVADGIYELPNGCLCCSKRDDLVQTLQTLMATRRRQFDAVVIETSGIADPGPVASAFWTDIDEDVGLGLRGVITVVDAPALLPAGTPGARPLAPADAALLRRQIAYADVLLLNKTDVLLGGESDVAACRHAVGAVNATAALHATVRSGVDLEALLSLAAYEDLPPVLGSSGGDGAEHAGRCGGCGAEAHEHGEEGSSCASRGASSDCGGAGGDSAATDAADINHLASLDVGWHALSTASPVRWGRVREWVARLLWDGVVPDPAAARADGGSKSAATAPGLGEVEVLRGKGLLWCSDGPSDADDEEGSASAGTAPPPLRPYIFQSVGQLFEIEEARGAAAADAHARAAAAGSATSTLVLIGRGAAFLHATLSASFEAFS